MRREANPVGEIDATGVLTNGAHNVGAEAEDGLSQTSRASADGVNTSIRPKILLIGSIPPPLGGVTVHIARLSSQMKRRGYDVKILDESREKKNDFENIRNITARNYLALLKRADVVHIHSSNAIVRLFHVVAARALGRKVVVTVHSARVSGFSRFLYRAACHLAHRSIPVSAEIRDDLALSEEPIPAFLQPDPSEMIVPDDIAHWMSDRRREGRKIVVSNASNLLLFGGQDLYGVDLLVDVFSRAQISQGYALLFVVSLLKDGVERYHALQREIEKRRLAPFVRLICLDAPFAGIIANSDVVVRATNTDGDALTVREALWCGRRVVASDCVKRPEGTELFRTRDADDLAAKLISGNSSPAGGFPTSDFIEKIDEIYRRCLTRDALRPSSAAQGVPYAAENAPKKRILVIAQFYAPDITAAAFRISETVGLLRQSADVRVITAVPHKAQVESTVVGEEPDVIRVAIRPYQGGGAINYILHYLSFVVTATLAGIKLRRSGWRPNVIWVSSPPLFVGIAGDALRRIMKCPLVLDIRDIWPDSAVGAKMITSDGTLFRLGKVLERWLYARADRMTCVSKAMQKYLEDVSGKPVHVVYNGILESSKPQRAPNVKRRILYAGNLGRAQGLDVLISAFAEARNRSPHLEGWRVDFIGSGVFEESLRSHANTLNIGDSVGFLGVRDKPSALMEMQQSAALFINLLSEAVFALTVPSKVFDCMFAGRPILYGVENSEARGILAETGGNIEFTANDKATLTEAILRLAEDQEKFATLAQRNSDVVLSRYSRQEATSELLVALDAAQKPPLATTMQSVEASGNSVSSRIGRQIAFARHVPVRRLMRRGQLQIKRHWLQRFPPTVVPDSIDVALASHPPEPLMAARPSGATYANGELTVTLLGATRTLSHPIAWTDPRSDRRSQLWWMTLNYMEYLEGVDDDVFSEIVGCWISSTRPYEKGYWRDVFNSYVVAIRTVVWMQQLARRPGLAPALVQKISNSLVAQITFLEHNLETDIGGNHLVKNIKALILGSVYFDGLSARRWRALGVEMLARELPRQILADGAHFERSISYHNQVFIDLLEIRHTLGFDPLGGQLDKALGAMAQVTADLAHEDGMPVQFSDAGLHMSYASKDALDAYARVFGNKPEQRRAASFPDAGYFGWGGDRDRFVVDCGPIGADDLPGHGHGDILSFEWSVGGKRLIVDQGVFEYIAGEKRAAARSARFHNTLSLDGQDQAEFYGDFRVGRRPRVKVLEFHATPDEFVLEGCHDGFAPLRHRRRFDVTRSEITVRDVLEGECSTASVRVGLLLHPEAVAIVDGDCVRIESGDHKIKLWGSVKFDIEPAVWWPDLGIEVPTTRLVAHWPVGCRAATFTLKVEC